jgi:plastocyanin
MKLFLFNNNFATTFFIMIIFSLALNVISLSASYASTSISNQSNGTNTTDLVSSDTSTSLTEFENSTIILTATRIGTEGNNYIWTSEGRNSPTLNLKPNTNYEFIVNTMPGDINEHELKITTVEGEEIAEGDSVDEGESTQFVFNSGQPRILSYFCEYHPTSMIGPINVTE